MRQSTYRLTVPQDLYDAVCAGAEQTFADSYLFGAKLDGRKLWPRTRTGYEKMRDRSDFMGLLRKLDITLEQPPLWPGDGTRLSHKDIF